MATLNHCLWVSSQHHRTLKIHELTKIRTSCSKFFESFTHGIFLLSTLGIPFVVIYMCQIYKGKSKIKYYVRFVSSCRSSKPTHTYHPLSILPCIPNWDVLHIISAVMDVGSLSMFTSLIKWHEITMLGIWRAARLEWIMIGSLSLCLWNS